MYMYLVAQCTCIWWLNVHVSGGSMYMYLVAQCTCIWWLNVHVSGGMGMRVSLI